MCITNISMTYFNLIEINHYLHDFKIFNLNNTNHRLDDILNICAELDAA